MADQFPQKLNTLLRDTFKWPATVDIKTALGSQLKFRLFDKYTGAANNFPSKPGYAVLGQWDNGKLSDGRVFMGTRIFTAIRPTDPATADSRIISDLQLAAKYLGLKFNPMQGVPQELGRVLDWPGVDPWQNGMLVQSSAIANPRAYFGFGVPGVGDMRTLVEAIYWQGQKNQAFIDLTNLAPDDADWAPAQDLEIEVSIGGQYVSDVVPQ